IADDAVVDPLHALDVRTLVAPLGAGDDAEVLLLRFLVGGQHLADAGRIDGDRLLGEEVLARLDDRLDVQGPEARRRGQHDQVAAVDDLLIGVEPDEAAVVGDVELLLGGAGLLQPVAAGLQVVLEGVAQSVDLDVVAGAGCLADIVRGAGAPATAADQADLDGIAARGVRVAQQAQADGGGGRTPQEVPPGGGGSYGRGWFGHGSSPGALGVGFGSGPGPDPFVLNQSCDRSRSPRSTLIALRLILPRRQLRSAG